MTPLEERTLLTTPTLVTLAESGASPTYGQVGTFTATVTTNPPGSATPSGGMVTFKDGTTILGSPQPLVQGIAKISVSSLGAGTHVVTADYSGTDTFGASTIPLSPPPVIDTVAGGGDPTQRQALYTYQFEPTGVAIDDSGNLFIAESELDQVDEIDSSTGAVTIVAGNGKPGYLGDDGPAIAAEMRTIGTIALDDSGDLFIADSGNNVVREVNRLTGIITTVAGDGIAGYSGDGGLATAAALSVSGTIALDGSGDLFIADDRKNLIREVNLKSGTITTVAGDGVAGYSGDGGPATAATLDDPSGLAVDDSRHLFVADGNNAVVREVDLESGIISAIAGDGILNYSGDGGPAVEAGLGHPESLAIDAYHHLFVSDELYGVIRQIGLVSQGIKTVAGNGVFGYSGDGGPATSATLGASAALVVDPLGDLYLADSEDSVIREVNAGTGLITTIAGGAAQGYSGDAGPAAIAELAGPASIAPDGTNVLIADSLNNVIREVNSQTGIITTIAGGQPAVSDPLGFPSAVAIDQSGDVFIADTRNNVVRKLDHSTGALTIAAGNRVAGYNGDGGPATAAELKTPEGLAVSESGQLFIADEGNCVIRAVNLTTGLITTVAGDGNYGYSGDGGLATDAELSLPEGLALDGSGNLFIADTFNNVIREVNLTTGVITTVAGDGQKGYGGDGGPATEAALNFPESVATDGSGGLYIADTYNSVIREVDLDSGKISTVAGTGVVGFAGDLGPAASAELSYPESVALDGPGDLIITDTGNSTIREVDLETGLIKTIAGIRGDFDYTGDGGPATSATLHYPWDVVANSLGDLLIADGGNNAIREIDGATGIIMTIADPGFVYDSDNGPATAAAMLNPDGLVVGSRGDIFIADEGFLVIREVNATTGNMITVAGDGTSGYSGDGGAATAAELGDVDGLALDGLGDLFIADQDQQVIRKVNLETGIITTVAGDGTRGYSGDGGPATSAELDNPSSVAVDGSGDLFIADTGNNRIRELNLETGIITTVAGDGLAGSYGDDGPAADAELERPSGIATDGSGHLFIADTGNDAIREVDLASGTMSTVVGRDHPGDYETDDGPDVPTYLRGPSASPSIPPGTCSSPTPPTMSSARYRLPPMAPRR